MEITNKKRIIIIALVIAVLGVFAYAIYHNTTREPEGYTGPSAEVNERADAIEGYVRANLATLSPVEPTMGGSFYITRIRLLNGEGTVWYEDGHMAHIADFTYDVSDNNENVSVTSFTLREADSAPVKQEETTPAQ